MKPSKMLVLMAAGILGVVAIVAGLALKMFGEAVSIVAGSGARLEFSFDTTWDGTLLVIGSILLSCGVGSLVLTGQSGLTPSQNVSTGNRSVDIWLLAEERFLVLAGSATDDSSGQLPGARVQAEEKAKIALKPVLRWLAGLESSALLEAFGRWWVARRDLDGYLVSRETGEEFLNTLNAANAALEDIRRHSAGQ